MNQSNGFPVVPTPVTSHIASLLQMILPSRDESMNIITSK